MMTNVEFPLSIYQELKEDIINGKLDEVKESIRALESRLGGKEFSITEEFFVRSVLGKYYRKVKNYDKAGDYSRSAIRLSKNIEKDYLEEVIDTYLDYAHLEIEYGQESNGRIELAKLLALLDTNHYQDDYTYGVIYSSLAKVSLHEENIESSITQFEKALLYYSEALPETHPVLISAKYTLSDVLVQIENYADALELHQQIWNAYTKEKDPLSAARELLKIGEINFYIDLKEARKVVTKAIKTLASLPEEVPLDIVKAVLMLAEIDENMGNFPRAINYYKQALEQLIKIYEKNHFMIVYIYSKIGTISIRTFKISQAKEYLEEGLTLSHPFPKIRMQFLYALGKIYSDEKSYDKAEAVFTAFLERLEGEDRKNSMAYGNTLQALAFNYIDQNQIEKAFELYEEALTIYDNISNCKEEKGLTLIRLGYCYENRKEPNRKKAEQCYEKGFKQIEKTPNQELLEEVLAGIIDFYSRNDQPEKRKVYEEKFVQLTNKNQ
ncbi:tetratricopeptide repeat protein [Oceanobacillus sp. FSL W7-1293]|uniref:tetratricopeptide repeat protein n=1 Tax=Oceanobacillus sp. FSL W7-1293 TaxID=2921699 RepID=UPI0030CC62DB